MLWGEECFLLERTRNETEVPIPVKYASYSDKGAQVRSLLKGEKKQKRTLETRESTARIICVQKKNPSSAGGMIQTWSHVKGLEKKSGQPCMDCKDPSLPLDMTLLFDFEKRSSSTKA